MKIIGRPNAVVELDGYISGPGGQIPIEMFSSDNTVGRIAIARVSVPPQYAQQISDLATKDQYRIFVGEKGGEMFNVFTGYISGKFTRFHSGSIRTGLDLIHPARDMDQMRLAAPGLHCGSVADYKYYHISVAKYSDETGPGKYPYFEGGGNIASAFIEGLMIRLMEISSVQIEDPYFDSKEESLGPCIEALASIKVMNGELNAGNLIQGDHNPINRHINERVEASFLTYASIWDTVSTVLSDYGMLLICNPDGTTMASVDLGGIKPSDSNYVGGEIITLFDSSSAFYRNVKSVIFVSNEVMSAPGIGDPNDRHTGVVISYPIPEPDDDQGANLMLAFPPWLENLGYGAQYNYTKKEPASSSSSISHQEEEESLGNASTDSVREATKSIQYKYAQMRYTIERNKMRTFSVTTVMCPTAVPGTNALIIPWGDVTPFGAGGPNIDMSTQFSGYCSTVQHLVDVQSRNISTTFTFRNVTSDLDELVESNPLYSDAVSFPWD
jgi:hypothetical protein